MLRQLESFAQLGFSINGLGQLSPILKLTSQLPDTYASKLPSVFALRLARDSANPMSKWCADEFV